MNTEEYAKTDVKWPVFVETDERSLDGVTLTWVQMGLLSNAQTR